MKSFYTLLFCVFALSSFGQSEKLIGKWNFAGVRDSTEIDVKGREMMRAFFGSMSVTFQEDSLYQSYMMGKSEYGFWSKKNSSDLVLKTENGSENKLTYKFISKDLLELELITKVFILKRGEISKLITIDSLKVLPSAVSITAEEAAKKWYYVSTVDTAANDEFSDMANTFLKGAYIHLKRDGSFYQDVKLVETEGTWRMVHDGKAFETTSEGISQVFYIMKYEVPYLTFLNPVSGKRFLYSSQESNE
jgi:hypothetical protein